MRNIPEDFEVCDVYLRGLDKEDFITAFRILHHIFRVYYETAETKPEELGLPCYDIEQYRALGKEPRESEVSLLWLPVVIFAMGNAGVLEDDQLIINIACFKENLKGRKTKHLPYQIQFLQDNGFTFTNFNGKNFSSKEGYFSMEYPDNPDVLAVLKAATEKVNAIEMNPNEPQKFDLYRITQFPHMLETLFADPSGEVIPYDDSYMSRILEAPYGEFHKEWNQFMKEQGLTIVYEGGFGKNRFLDAKGKDSLNFYEYANYRRGKEAMCKLMLRLKLRNPNRYMDYIETLPEEVKSTFKNVGCGHCMEKCPRRITYTIDGEYKECCGCFGFEFWYTLVEYIEYYKKLFLLEQEVSSKK
jgi:hypothetical protein